MSGFEIKDLAGLSEPACKLIDGLREATGVLYEPTRIRRKAKAEADGAIIEAKAQLEVKQLQHRAFERMKAKETRRQVNIENIVSEATKHLPEGAEPQKPDDDWVSAFMNSCQDIGNEDMQKLWGRILAGEFASPGTFSARTLNFVKLLSKPEAEMFSNFCRYIWDTGGAKAYLNSAETDVYLNAHGFTFPHRLHLESLGLIKSDFQLRINFKEPEGLIHYSGSAYRVIFERGHGGYELPCVVLTNLGEELFRLCRSGADIEYVKILTESLRPRVTLIPSQLSTFTQA